MGRLSIEDRLRVITLHSNNYSLSSIRKRFKEEKIPISLPALYSLVKKYREKNTIVDLPRRRKQRKIDEEMVKFIEQELKKNDELTSTGITALLSVSGQICESPFLPSNELGKRWVGSVPGPTIASCCVM